MKLYKGDVIRFPYPYDYCTGKILNNGGSFDNPARVKITEGLVKGITSSLGCFSYEITGFNSEQVRESVKLIRPGWTRRQRRSFWKRLKYLFLNRF